MGKLIERLERIQRSSGPRLGFGASSATKEPRIALVGILPIVDAKLAAAAVENGAHCLLVRQITGRKASGPLAQALGVGEGIPCGGFAARQASPEGWDFAVLEATDPLEPLLEAENVDKVLRLDAEIPDAALRALDSLPIDAVLLPELATPLTVQGLIGYYKVAKATSKAVLAFAPSHPSNDMLKALRDTGIAGILIDVQSATQAKALADLRKAVESLPPRKAKAPTRATPLVPQASFGAPQATPPPDEDDDEDE